MARWVGVLTDHMKESWSQRAGHEFLILAYRPFPALQPYAETGPIFLHAEQCDRAPETDVLPDMFKPTPDYILRGYGHDDRIVYGSGAVVPTHQICGRAHELRTHQHENRKYRPVVVRQAQQLRTEQSQHARQAHLDPVAYP